MKVGVARLREEISAVRQQIQTRIVELQAQEPDWTEVVSLSERLSASVRVRDAETAERTAYEIQQALRDVRSSVDTLIARLERFHKEIKSYDSALRASSTDTVTYTPGAKSSESWLIEHILSFDLDNFTFTTHRRRSR